MRKLAHQELSRRFVRIWIKDFQQPVGNIQIASFHPGYQFAETEAEDVENYTNRSPYPMLHLLREESVTRVAASEEELLAIPERNMETMRRLGIEAVKEKLRVVTED